MKKSLLIATLVGAALTSCVSESQEYPTPQQELTFGVSMLKQSRANVKGEITGKQYPVNESFMVYSIYYTGAYQGWKTSAGVGNYFANDGEAAKHQNSYWETDVVHYWPDAGYNLAFAAYSPAELPTAPTSIAQTATGLVIEDFKTEPEADNQFDLMYSARVVDKNKANNGGKEVQLVFNHALSSISFSSVKAGTDVNYQITGLTLSGKFVQQGTFNQGITGTTTGGVYTETEHPTWSLVDPTASITYKPSFAAFNVPSGTPLQFTSGTSALLLIPQTIPSDATVKVTYTKTTNPGTTNAVTLTNTIDIPLSSFKDTENSSPISTWERGKRYIYRIAFGENTQIYFKPEITDWVTVPTLVYTIQ